MKKRRNNQTIPDVQINMMQRTLLETIIPEDFTKKGAMEPSKLKNGIGLVLYPMPDPEFEKILSVNSSALPGILINTAIYSDESKNQGGKLHL